MDHPLRETTEYLFTFFSYHIAQYREDIREYRPENGYGKFYRDNDVIQIMWNIILNIEEEFSDMRIPEKYSSPQHLANTIIAFRNLLIKQNTIFDDVYSKYRKKEVPSPISVAYHMNSEVLSAVDWVLDFSEMKKFNSDVQKAETTKGAIMEKIIQILEKFGNISRQLLIRHQNNKVSRDTIKIDDEYDVQDLLHALLILYFDDIRTEEWTPSYAGGSNRIDFLLKEEKIVIETKMTRDTLKDKEIGEQLIIDIAKYKQHTDCKNLICFIFDPKRLLNNPKGLISLGLIPRSSAARFSSAIHYE
jgi:hypothetical protein